VDGLLVYIKAEDEKLKGERTREKGVDRELIGK